MLRRVGTFMVLLLAVGCRSSPSAPLTFADPPTAITPGEALDVSGGGCPAKGTIPLAQPEQVEVILQPGPPRDSDTLWHTADDGHLAFVGFALATSASAQRFVVGSDGRWSGSIAAVAAQPGAEWSLTATCLTRVKRASGMESEQQIDDDDPTIVVSPIPVR